jgi:alpha-tubulin suppressor-like RCC1 family protein
MAKNATIVRLKGTGTWTVPAGVTQINIYSEFNGVSSIAAGPNFSVIRNQSGAAYMFGANTYGQLGDSTLVNKSSPVPVVGGYSFVQVATGGGHCIGIESDGRAYAWGLNRTNDLFPIGTGQLGDNSILDKSSPVLVVGGHSFIQVAAGTRHSLALKADGSVYAWGQNTNSQLGNNDPTSASKSSPVPVSGSHAFIQVAAGGNHSLALKADGSVYTWGYNSNGQLGDNSIVSKSTPVLVSGSHAFIQVAGGLNYSLALKADGSVYAWGQNTNGQLGDNSITAKSSPVPVSGSHAFIQVAGGTYHSLALKADGSVYAWGSNINGQLGDNSTADKSSPVLVSGSHSFIQVAASKNFNPGLESMFYHSMAVKSNGQVYTWGGNIYGELGDNTVVVKSSPVLISGTYFISDLSGSSLRYSRNVTPGESISYKASGLSPNYFGDIPIASDMTEIIIKYFS